MTTEGNQNPENAKKKATVGMRLEIPKKLHRRAMRRHKANPREMNFQDTVLEAIDAGLKAKGL